MSNADMKANRYGHWALARKKLRMIESALASGKTVWIGTMLTMAKVTPKTAAKFTESQPLFKATRNGLFMAHGKRFDCIDYCSIQVEG